MPILFHFENQKLLLWLVEFQEDKGKFSIYKLLRYTTDLMEACPDALVIPTVLFTDRKKWRKPVMQQLHTQLNGRQFLHFEYVFHKLFDFKARDYYNSDNPVAKILLPKMSYNKEDRIEVIRHAYAGLFQLVSSGLFDKYLDFIDTYAEIDGQEQLDLYDEIVQHKETAMLAQYIRERGKQDGIKEGMEEGLKKGMEKGIEKGRKKGLMEGRKVEKKENLISVTRRAKQKGFPMSTIADIVDLDVSTINKKNIE